METYQHNPSCLELTEATERIVPTPKRRVRDHQAKPMNCRVLKVVTRVGFGGGHSNRATGASYTRTRP